MVIPLFYIMLHDIFEDLFDHPSDRLEAFLGRGLETQNQHWLGIG